LLEEIFEHLCLTDSDEEWTGLDELRGIAEMRGLGEKETEDIMSFLRSYFLEVDEIRKRARLSSWARSFFHISGP